MAYQIKKKYSGVLVVTNLENGYKFFIAKDSMGTQICKDGAFFPDSRDFGSIENALKFLNQDNNMNKAEEFFRTHVVNPARNLFDVMTGILLTKENSDDNSTQLPS